MKLTLKEYEVFSQLEDGFMKYETILQSIYKANSPNNPLGSRRSVFRHICAAFESLTEDQTVFNTFYLTRRISKEDRVSLTIESMVFNKIK